MDSIYLYQQLIDADVSEFEIETLIGEGWTLKDIYEAKVSDAQQSA